MEYISLFSSAYCSKASRTSGVDLLNFSRILRQCAERERERVEGSLRMGKHYQWIERNNMPA